MSRFEPSPPKRRRGFLMRRRQGLAGLPAPRASRQAGKSRAGGALPTSLPSRLSRSPHDNRPIHQTFAAFTPKGLPRRPRLAPPGFTYRHMYKPLATLGNLGGLVPPRCIVQGPWPVSGGVKSAGGPARWSPILSREEEDALNHGRYLFNSPATHPRSLRSGPLRETRCPLTR